MRNCLHSSWCLPWKVLHSWNPSCWPMSVRTHLRSISRWFGFTCHACGNMWSLAKHVFKLEVTSIFVKTRCMKTPMPYSRCGVLSPYVQSQLKLVTESCLSRSRETSLESTFGCFWARYGFGDQRGIYPKLLIWVGEMIIGWGLGGTRLETQPSWWYSMHGEKAWSVKLQHAGPQVVG